MEEIRNGSRLYQVGEKVAQAANYHLYMCTQVGTKRQYLLQIATTVEHNGGLQRAVYILGELKRLSDKVEAEYQAVKKDQKVLLNYQLGFPEVVDSFVCQEQGGRRINILAFRNVENMDNLLPLIYITLKNRQRIDSRTSVWIMGKLLKLLVFAHSEGVSVGLLSGNNIVLETKQHYVVILDWATARMYPEAVPKDIQRQEISQAAQAVVIALGGDPETGTFPDDGDSAYTDYILQLARGNSDDAQRAHEEFYKIADSLWERKYYRFTTKRLDKE